MERDREIQFQLWIEEAKDEGNVRRARELEYAYEIEYEQAVLATCAKEFLRQKTKPKRLSCPSRLFNPIALRGQQSNPIALRGRLSGYSSTS